jgi:hypothetical protein
MAIVGWSGRRTRPSARASDVSSETFADPIPSALATGAALSTAMSA